MTRKGNRGVLTTAPADPCEDVLEEWHCLTWRTDIFHHKVREFSYRSFSLMLEFQPKICQSVLYLFLYDKGKSGAKFDARTYVTDKNGKEIFVQVYKGSLQNGPTVWSLERDELLNSEDNFLGKGIISFGFEIGLYAETLSVLPTPLAKEDRITEAPNSTSLEKLSVDFSKLFDNDDGSDVVLQCGEQHIKAHKHILSTRSDVFAAMFRSDMSESHKGVVVILDMIPEILDRLILYIYSGKVEELTVETASQLYEAADKYGIESLRCSCASFLTENLTQISAYDILLLAECHGDEQLENHAVNFMVQNIDFLRSEQFDKFAEKHPSLAIKVYKKYIHKPQYPTYGVVY